MIFRLCIAVAWIFFFTSCSSNPTTGYSSSSLYDQQFGSVAIQIFDNETMSRNMEFMLEDALVKQIQARTPYRVLDDTHADTMLRGTITNNKLRAISQSRTTGLDNEVMITVTVDFEWLNLATGKRILGRDNFSTSALFIPSRPSSEPLEMGQFAVVQQLSSDIVDQLQAAW
ncbi:MAG: LptE family protein [Phycisphaerales bacterium]|nr:LptE family protein [Phycisphaerales bacterium]MDP6693743.1 LptE family protein [Phycisphaerales bacterium]